MNIVRIALDQVETHGRLRPVDPEQAALIAASLVEHGQMTPIEVRATPKANKPYALVAGAHRVAGALENGWTDIEAVVFVGSADEAALREIDENLIRHELKELDRATFLARRKALYDKLHPQVTHGGDRRTDQHRNFANLVGRFTEDAAERLNLSKSIIDRALRRAKIDPIARDAIQGLWIADHGAQLDALVKLPAGGQQQVARVLRDMPAIRSVAAALAQIEGRVAAAPDPVADQVAAFLRLWKRMHAPARAQVRAFITKPDGSN